MSGNGLEAGVGPSILDVRFAPKSGLSTGVAECPLSAISGYSTPTNLSPLCANKQTSDLTAEMSAFEQPAQPVDATLYLREQRWG
jgi:hypothetical protein